MKRHVYVLAAIPLVCWWIQGCSSSDSTSGDDTTNQDGGSGDDSSTGNGSDGSANPGKDGSVGEGGGGDGGVTVTTPGTQLSTVGDVNIVGVTTDGWVVYLNNVVGGDAGPGAIDGGAGQAASLEAVALTGGAPQIIAPNFVFATDDLAIAGKTVAVYKNIQPDANMNAIADSILVWTAADAKTSTVATKALYQTFAASDDGTHIAYTTGATATGITVTTSKSDGTTPVAFTTAGTPARIDNATCFPSVAFTKAVAFAQYCTTKAGTTGPLDSIDTGAATPKVVINATVNQNVFSVAGNASNVFWLKGATSIGEVSKADGTGVDVAYETNIGQAMLNADGTRLLYVDTDGGPLKTALTTTPVNAFQLTKGVLGILDNAHDYSSVIVNRSAIDQTTNQNVARVDLELASAFDAGTPTQLTDAGIPVGYDTANTHFFFMTDLPTTGGDAIGTLKAHPTAGGADKVIAQNVLSPSLVDTTTKAVWLQQQGMAAAVDIASTDAAGTGMPTIVVQGADFSYAVSGSKIVYSSFGKGIYAVAVP